MDSQTIQAAVRERYAGFVTNNQSCCPPSSICGCATEEDPSLRLGYGVQEIGAVPA